MRNLRWQTTDKFQPNPLVEVSQLNKNVQCILKTDQFVGSVVSEVLWEVDWNFLVMKLCLCVWGSLSQCLQTLTEKLEGWGHHILILQRKNVPTARNLKINTFNRAFILVFFSGVLLRMLPRTKIAVPFLHA